MPTPPLPPAPPPTRALAPAAPRKLSRRATLIGTVIALFAAGALAWLDTVPGPTRPRRTRTATCDGVKSPALPCSRRRRLSRVSSARISLASWAASSVSGGAGWRDMDVV